MAYYERRVFERTIKDQSKAIALKRDYPDAYTCRGNAYRHTGETNRAIADYNTAIHLKPDLAVAYHSRGESWLHLKVWEKARLDLTVAVAMGVISSMSFVTTTGVP